MKTRTNIKAGWVFIQHNETLVRSQAKRSLKIKTHLKAGVVKFR